MSIEIRQGDARKLDLPDDSVDLIVTSPPYWRQRDYRDRGESLSGQIGNEATYQEYIANLLDCAREWARVLKPGGSMFVVIDDKYTTRWSSRREGSGQYADRDRTGRAGRNDTGVAEKSLLGLPARFMIGCIDMGLIVRRDHIWAKPNPLPESPDDRCAGRHEYIFHIVKQPHYYSAIDLIREPHLMRPQRRPNGHRPRQALGPQPAQNYPGLARTEPGVDGNPLGRLPGSVWVWEIALQPLLVPGHIAHARCCGGEKKEGCKDGLEHYAAFPLNLPRKVITGWSPPGICTACGEGRRPVTTGGRTGDGAKNHKAARRVSSFDWEAWKESAPVAIAGYACACTPHTDHPGTRSAPSRRPKNAMMTDEHPQGSYGRKQAGEYERTGPWREYHFDRWTPPPTRPALVVDPFAGTGTTGLVADALGRDAILFELSADYCDLARWRTTDPAERARARELPKPKPEPDGQPALWDDDQLAEMLTDGA